MAQIFPSDIEISSERRFRNDEVATLISLRDGLPETYLVYHSVHWSRTERERAAFGEIDFVVVNNAGHVLVIEQKNGPLDESEKGLTKRYKSGEQKLIFSQVRRNFETLRDKFRLQNPGSLKLKMDYLIYCPDHRVVSVNAAGVDMGRTVDATSKGGLAERVQKILQSDVSDNPILRKELHNFMLGSFRIAPDVNTYKTKQKQVYRRLLSGLSEIIENLEFEPFRLRIVGTAGSGKTQVTMRFCRRALDEGRRPLLLCFNRPLADKFAAQAPEGVTVSTYHGFVREMAEQAGITIDFNQSDDPKFWRMVQEELVGADLSVLPTFDCLVVDEGQDFKDNWYDIIRFFVEEGSTELWLEDPLQNLRGTEAVSLPGFVTYREMANFRTPGKIARFIKAALDVDFEVKNELPGIGVGVYDYESDIDLQKLLNLRVLELSKVGFLAEDITIVSCRGMTSTVLKDLSQVGKFEIRRFTGKYNANNEQIYTDGELCFETIFRFKGQQAPVVILTDLDETIKDNDWAKTVLYCAMTRATVRLELMVSSKCPWLQKLQKAEE